MSLEVLGSILFMVFIICGVPAIIIGIVIHARRTRAKRRREREDDQ